MTVTLLSLPVELQLRIFALLDADPEDSFDTFLHWSSTCSFYRTNLAPFVFRTLELRNTERSGGSIQAIARSPYSKHVRKLRYKGLLYCDDHNEVDGFEDDEEQARARAEMDVPKDLLDAVQAVLSDLESFPTLDSLRIEFEFDDTWGWGEDGYPYTVLLESSEEEDAEAIEAVKPWRSLMAKSFDAVAQNAGSCIKHLEIAEYIAQHVSTYSQPQFQRFLAALESFKLSIKGGDNGAGWCINMMEGYYQATGWLSEFFFKHMTSLVDLSISCPDTGPLGLQGQNHSPLNLAALPRLKSLYLNTCFIDPELAHFLAGHAATLESVVLDKCYASPDNYNATAMNPICWRIFFEKARALKKLRRFEVRPATAPLTRKEAYSDTESSEEESEAVREVRETMNTDSSRRLFAYGFLDDKYGILFEDEETNLGSFQQGEDQEAYDLLMADVRNRAS